MSIPSHFIGKSDHAPHAAPMENPCSPHGEPMPLIRGYHASHQRLPCLSRWGIPPPRPPPWYGRARPCARAERERGGSGAAAERRPTGTSVAIAQPQHPAPRPHSTQHVQRQKQPPAATHPPMLTPHRLPCHSTWNMAGCSPHVTECAHALRAVPCSTTRESPRHSTPGAHALRAVPRSTTRESPRHSTPGTHALRAVPRSTTRPTNCPSLSRGVPP